MASPSGGAFGWLSVIVLAAFGWLAILLEMAPLNEDARAFPAPDLLFCVCAYFALRRPSGSPGLLVGVLGLCRDLVSGGPVGLGAMSLIAGVETMRSVGDAIRHVLMAT